MKSMELPPEPSKPRYAVSEFQIDNDALSALGLPNAPDPDTTVQITAVAKVVASEVGAQIPTPEAGDTPGDEIPSFSPSAKESASKRRERTVACGGDTLTPGDEIPSQELAFAGRARAVTADVTQGPEGGAEPDRPVEEPTRAPAAVSQDQAFPSFMRRYIDMLSASGAHLEPVAQHELDDDAKIPEFLRRQGVKPRDYVPGILRTAEAVTLPVTQSQAPAASVTAGVTAPIAGSICPTCKGRVSARLSDAERQRARRARQRERSKPVP